MLFLPSSSLPLNLRGGLYIKWNEMGTVELPVYTNAVAWVLMAPKQTDIRLPTLIVAINGAMIMCLRQMQLPVLQ